MEDGGFARRLWHVMRAIYYMVRRGLCRKRVMMDLHLLLGRGKLAGKAFRNLLSSAHPGHGAGASSAASAGAMSFYRNPRDVEFSCTTTPAHPPVFSFKNAARRGRRGECGGLDAAAVARAFEMLNAEVAGGETPATPAVGATPSPMLPWSSLGRSPANVRQLRITDSPFPVVPEGDEHVDAEAEEFIRRFYEQLMIQQSKATPECRARRRG